MRRLFSTFAPGWPGAGLLLMRVVAGISLIIHGLTKLQTGLPIHFIVLALFAIATGILLLAGLWTPVAGSRWQPSDCGTSFHDLEILGLAFSWRPLAPGWHCWDLARGQLMPDSLDGSGSI